MRFNWILPVALISSVSLPAQVDAPNPRLLVLELKHLPAKDRRVTERKLVALGAAAVTPLLDAFETAGDQDQFACRILRTLGLLGSAGGGAVPRLVKTVRKCRPPVLLPLLRTIGTLTPFRAVDVKIRGISMHLSGRRPVPGVTRIPELESFTEYHRVAERARFPLQPDRQTLLGSLQSYKAYRVELAIEWLSRGEPQRAALPGLLRILDQPDPRIAWASRRVPLRRAAAKEVLRITTKGEPAVLARAVLNGAKPKPQREIPKSARDRIAELIAELGSKDKVVVRRAAENLWAYGRVATPALAAALPDLKGSLGRSAALEAIRKLGKQGAGATLALAEILTEYPAEHTVEIFEALTATIPWSRDVVPTVTYSYSLGQLDFHGIRIQGDASAAVFTRLNRSYYRLSVASTVDAQTSVVELERLLESKNVYMRELAIRILRSRGPEAAPTVPGLIAAMGSTHPQANSATWNQDGSVSLGKISRDAQVHRLAAEAILAVAPSNAEATAAARAKIAKLKAREK